MPNLKIKMQKSKFHLVHLLAILILGSYFFISKINTVHALTQENIIISFLQLYLFGTSFGLFLLYILSHDKFFPVGREIEKEEEKKEKSYLKKYLHHGKILATSIIGMIGGPLFLSLTIRLLLNSYRYKYVLVFIVSFISTALTFLLGKSIINFLI